MCRIFCVAVLSVVLTVGSALGQDEIASPLSDEHAGWVERGVLKVISPEPIDGETFTGPIELHEIRKGLSDIDYTPHFEPKSQTVYERAKDVTLRRPIWSLEFSFKPVRMVEVDVPQPEGRMRRKLIWYMVYRVRNLGGHLQPTAELAQSEEVRDRLVDAQLSDAEKEGVQKRIDQYKVFETQPVAQLPKEAFPQIMLFPSFVLRAHDFDKEYLDRLIPAAVPVIAAREKVGRTLHDSVTISRQKIEVTTAEQDNSVWGVAMWEDVDPRIDFFSVYVQGLTNAFRFEDDPEKYRPGDKPARGRTFTRKTLLLHFWRPGDTIDEDEREVRFGMPKETDPQRQAEINAEYGEETRLDYRWVYR
jgi:hypothetical protein